MKNIASMWLILCWILAGLTFSQPSVGQEESFTLTQNITLGGIISDADGVPVAGAKVWLIDNKNRSTSSSPNAQVRSVTSDQSGKYQFRFEHVAKVKVAEQLPRQYGGQSPPIGSCNVVALKPGFALGHTRSSWKYEPDNKKANVAKVIELPLGLAKAAPRRVKVLNADGTAAAGVTLALQMVGQGKSFLDTRGQPELMSTLEVKTNAVGEATIGYLAKNDDAWIDAVSAQAAGETFFLAAKADTELQTLKLLPTGTISVSLLSDVPEQKANRRVTIRSKNRPRGPSSQMVSREMVSPIYSSVVTKTDQNGNCKARIGIGKVSLSFDAANDSKYDQYPEPPAAVDLESGQSVTLGVKFKPGVVIQGQVQTPEGDPISGVTVTVNNTYSVSDADGKLEFHVRNGERFWARIVGPPLDWAFPFFDHVSFQELSRQEKEQAADGQPVTRMLKPIILRRAATVTGIVTDEDGKPVDDVKVRASWTQSDENDYDHTTDKSDGATTNQAREFVIDRVYPDVDLLLSAISKDACTAATTKIRLGEPTTDIQLTVFKDQMVQVVGRIVGRDGKPVTTAQVKLFGKNRSTVKTDEDGRFLLPNRVSRSRNCNVEISATEFLSRNFRSNQPLASGSQFDLGDIVLNRVRNISGEIRDSSGKPISERDGLGTRGQGWWRPSCRFYRSRREIPVGKFAPRQRRHAGQ